MTQKATLLKMRIPISLTSIGVLSSRFPDGFLSKLRGLCSLDTRHLGELLDCAGLILGVWSWLAILYLLYIND